MLDNTFLLPYSWIVIFNPYFKLFDNRKNANGKHIYENVTFVCVCFLLNYFLKKGYPRMIEMNTDKGHSSYS